MREKPRRVRALPGRHLQKVKGDLRRRRRPKVPDPPGGQVLGFRQRAMSWRRPYRESVTHTRCGKSYALLKFVAESFARQPDYRDTLFCPHCPPGPWPIGRDGEFVWAGTDDKVGT